MLVRLCYEILTLFLSAFIPFPAPLPDQGAFEDRSYLLANLDHFLESLLLASDGDR